MGDSRGQAKAATMETQGRARLLQPRLLRSPGPPPAPPPPHLLFWNGERPRGCSSDIAPGGDDRSPAEKGDPLQASPVSKPGEREMKLGLVST